jgi:ABC-2 type transport system ATP-binding protein
VDSENGFELLGRVQRGEAGSVIDSYFFGKKLHLLVSQDSSIKNEAIFEGSFVKEITPSMEDVFAYLVKKESAKELDGGRISGTGEIRLNIDVSTAKEG